MLKSATVAGTQKKDQNSGKIQPQIAKEGDASGTAALKQFESMKRKLKSLSDVIEALSFLTYDSHHQNEIVIHQVSNDIMLLNLFLAK